MAGSPIDLLLQKIEAYFGPYGRQDIREDVGRYLFGRISPAKHYLQAALDAIKEQQPVRFGPPDVATTKAAISAYESEKGVSLKEKESYSTADPPSREELAQPTPEELEEVERLMRNAAERDPAAQSLLRLVGHDFDRHKDRAS